MLRLIIIALLLYGAYYVASSMMGNYKSIQRQNGTAEVAPAGNSAPAAAANQPLEGMAPQLQPSLDAAEAQGPTALKRWLDACRPRLRDPKLGDIELDYAVALLRQNSIEARATYRAVKDRTPANSPLQPRLKSLSRTFE